MSSSDYFDGVTFAQARARRSQKDAQAAIGEWREYAEGLVAKLKAAEMDALKNGAQLAGRDAQQQALRKALSALDPAHPLLAELPQIGNSAAADYLDEYGYDYDAVSGQLTLKAELRRRFGA
ncbi:hypothetical protein LL999_12335 [Burkholderia ambifaria]|uniref:hypothetical protein n=1 Tax=Burkholderia ambifaria TaxID=152480 RepID=UPI001E29EB80|nr:hypothetical protein [Burkholderia ambifaria]UEP20718.1 hypothetical protein LL999_12335 [Burkholderia ambifaria]